MIVPTVDCRTKDIVQLIYRLANKNFTKKNPTPKTLYKN